MQFNKPACLDSIQSLIYPGENRWWDQTKPFKQRVSVDGQSWQPYTHAVSPFTGSETQRTCSIHQSTVNVSPALLVTLNHPQTFLSSILRWGLCLQFWAVITSGSASTTGCLRGTSGGRTAARWWDAHIRHIGWWTHQLAKLKVLPESYRLYLN